VLIFLGFAGRGFEEEQTVRLLPGQQTTIGEYVARLDALKVTDDGQKQMITAHVAVFRDGRQIDTMYPAKWHFRKHEGVPTTEASIRRGLAEDFYIVLEAYEAEVQGATLTLHVNPLVDWVWLGFGIMAIGTGIALLPERAFSFALAKLPAEAATGTAALLLAVLLSAATLSAQTRPAAQQVAVVNLKPLERQMQGEILCMCGGCKSPLNDCPMLYCHMREPEKAILHDMVEQGQSRDQIIASFIQRYGGQDVLGAPLDKGFNRLAWLFPYLVGLGSAISVGLVAVRLSRRQASGDAADLREPDAALEQRLDDELRDLD
jgi:cytochrome c-type biogenesis protein CcmF